MGSGAIDFRIALIGVVSQFSTNRVPAFARMSRIVVNARRVANSALNDLVISRWPEMLMAILSPPGNEMTSTELVACSDHESADAVKGTLPAEVKKVELIRVPGSPRQQAASRAEL